MLKMTKDNIASCSVVYWGLTMLTLKVEPNILLPLRNPPVNLRLILGEKHAREVSRSYGS